MIRYAADVVLTGKLGGEQGIPLIPIQSPVPGLGRRDGSPRACSQPTRPSIVECATLPLLDPAAPPAWQALCERRNSSIFPNPFAMTASGFLSWPSMMPKSGCQGNPFGSLLGTPGFLWSARRGQSHTGRALSGQTGWREPELPAMVSILLCQRLITRSGSLFLLTCCPSRSILSGVHF